MLKKEAIAAFLLVVGLSTSPVLADNGRGPVSQPEWIQRSDGVTQQLLDIEFADCPEDGSKEGASQWDSEVSTPSVDHDADIARQRKKFIAALEAALQDGTDPRLAQDYRILRDYVHQSLRRREYAENQTVTFRDPYALVMDGFTPLLDPQASPGRKQAALIRLRRYAGLEPGYQPICRVMRERTETQMTKPGLVFPSRDELVTALGGHTDIAQGLQELFAQSGLEGWETALATLNEQLADYDAWVKDSLLPRARKDFRLTPEAYLRMFESRGITGVTPEQLAGDAHQAFIEIQSEMNKVAQQIAKERHLSSSDYRDVMKALKAEQIAPEAILPLYEKRLQQIEGLIKEHDLVTLPEGKTLIRLATPSEAARVPSPQMIPPPLVSNSGQRGQFVLPLLSPSGQRFDDFTYDAISWTVTAHEARPGHELQFDSMVDHGVSKARALFAANSANIEGWGLYCEWLIQPYMPLEGQLASLDGRLLRAARAFLDPELHAGKITPEEARRILTEDVLLSPALAASDVRRYTVDEPGQACSYFYGFNQLRKLRADLEKAQGEKFNAHQFHDFVLDQGLLPPPLLREAVERQFL